MGVLYYCKDDFYSSLAQTGPFIINLLCPCSV